MTLRTLTLSCGLLLLTIATTVSSAVPNSILRSNANRRKADAERAAADETRQRLTEAENRAAAERARLRRESSVKSDLAEKAAAAVKAGPLLPSAEENQRTEEATVILQSAFDNLSDEGRALLAKPLERLVTPEPEPVLVAQAVTAPPAAAPSPAPPPAASPPSPGSPKPQALRPEPVVDLNLQNNRTLITCSGASFFDANKSIGVFTENVRVYHPQFYLECDELEIHMKKSEPSADGTAPQSAAPAPPTSGLIVSDATSATDDEAEGPDAQPSRPEEESSIDKVIARGAMVTIEKFTETGDVQIGKCKWATYDGPTGVMTLRTWPQMQRGSRLQIATDASTVMTLTPEGAFKSVGPSRTEILQGDAATPTATGLRKQPDFGSE